MIDSIVLFLMFISYSVFEGSREAFYYHEATKTNDTIKKDQHPFFTAQRMCVLIMLLTLSANPLILLALVFVFPFFHDGMYYVERHRLNPAIYPKKFFDHSTTSTAFFEFSFAWRLILFIIGLLLFITTLIYTT